MASVNYQIFSGETPQEALRKAVEICGENAKVLNTTQVKKKTINSPALFEVTVLVENIDKPKKKTPPRITPHQAQKKITSSEDVLLNISQTAKQISKIAEVTTDKIGNEKQDKPHVHVSFDELKSIKQEIAKLSDKIQNVQHMVWEENSSKRGNLQIPPEFAEIYKLAHQSGMGSDHLNEIMRLTLKHMPINMKHSPLTVKRYFKTLLRRMVTTRNELHVTKGQQKVLMFVGPTGVGKTTTLAKLAARYSYIKEKRSKVGIITLDTYRIGAVEQLFQYAKMLHLPIEDVVDVNDFENALNRLKSCDIVLIDTVGSSPYDKEKLIKLDNFLRHTSTPIDVNLVLSAGSKLEDLKDIYQNYSFFDIDTLIFTKFDETKMFGNIFSLIYAINKPISYVSIGQEVPDDLEVASSEFIVSCMLDGFRKKDDKPSK